MRERITLREILETIPVIKTIDAADELIATLSWEFKNRSNINIESLQSAITQKKTEILKKEQLHNFLNMLDSLTTQDEQKKLLLELEYSTCRYESIIDRAKILIDTFGNYGSDDFIFLAGPEKSIGELIELMKEYNNIIGKYKVTFNSASANNPLFICGHLANAERELNIFNIEKELQEMFSTIGIGEKNNFQKLYAASLFINLPGVNKYNRFLSFYNKIKEIDFLQGPYNISNSCKIAYQLALNPNNENIDETIKKYVETYRKLDSKTNCSFTIATILMNGKEPIDKIINEYLWWKEYFPQFNKHLYMAAIFSILPDTISYRIKKHIFELLTLNLKTNGLNNKYDNLRYFSIETTIFIDIIRDDLDQELQDRLSPFTVYILGDNLRWHFLHLNIKKESTKIGGENSKRDRSKSVYFEPQESEY